MPVSLPTPSRSLVSVSIPWLLTLAINIFFLSLPILLIIPTCLYRAVRIFFPTQQPGKNKKIDSKQQTTGFWKRLNPFSKTHEDVFKNRQQILNRGKWKVEFHQAITPDRATLQLWRIVQSQSSQQNQPYIKKKVVLLQHGLLDCAMSWFLLQKYQNCLPYLLAQQGFDVWLSNNRGTKFSAKSIQDNQYWQYNLDHLIQYDTPTIIRHILSFTKQQRLIYLAHSQGTTQFLSTLDLHPDLHQKIELFIGLGPIISMKQLRVKKHLFLQMLSTFKICQVAKVLGFKCLLMLPPWMNRLVGVILHNSYIFYWFCQAIVNGLCGYNKGNSKFGDRFGVILSHQPGAASVTNVLHWINIYRTGQIHKFSDNNKKIIPYTYDSLRQLPFDSYLFRGTADSLITDQDFNYLVNKFAPQKCFVHIVQDYAHLDYLWSEQAAEDIYFNITSILQEMQAKQQKQSKSYNYNQNQDIQFRRSEIQIIQNLDTSGDSYK